MLTDTSWILRRVETVELLDHYQFERCVSLTVDLQELRRRARSSGLMWSKSAAIPLFTIVKSLLVDLDVRNASGESIALATSAQDSFCAQAVLLAVLEKNGINPDRLTTQVLEAIYSVVRKMPNDELRLESSLIDTDRPTRDYLLSLGPHLFSSNKDRDTWTSLFQVEAFGELLSDFAQQSMAVTSIPLTGNTTVVKYRHVELETSADEVTTAEAWGLSGFGYSVGARAIGTSQREHVRVVAPPGMTISSVLLMNTTPLTPYSGQAVGFAPETYASRVTTERAIVYTRRMPPGSYRVVATLRPRISSFLAPALFSVGLSAILLGAAAWLQMFNSWYFDRAPDEIGLFGGPDLEALTTTFLLAPTLLSLFIVRPGEHSLVSRLLVRPRVLVLLTAFALVICAMSVALGARELLLGLILALSAAFCLLVFSLLAVICFQCSRSEFAVRKRSHSVVQQHVVVVPWHGD